MFSIVRVLAYFACAPCFLLYSMPALPEPVVAEALTLDRAWGIAEQSNADFRRAQTELEAAQSEAAETSALLRNNPVVTLEPARRRIHDAGRSDSRFEGGAAIAQTIEIAGQQEVRRRIAGDQLSAVRATIAENRRQQRVEVENRFVRVLSLQQRVATEERLVKLMGDAATAVGKRVTAGEDSKLDGNLAQVEAERARNQLTEAAERLIAARANLAAALQLPARDLPEISGALDAEQRGYSLEELLAAVDNRPALQVAQHREAAARSRLDLARAGRYPDLTLGLSYGREAGLEGNDRISTLSLSLPLPVFYRNGAGIGRASADLTQVQIDRQSVNRDASAQVVSLWQRLEPLRARVARLNQSVSFRLAENRRLATLAYREGEIGVIQLLLVQRQNVDIERELLDARTELRLAQVALEAAAGWPIETDTER